MVGKYFERPTNTGKGPRRSEFAALFGVIAALMMLLGVDHLSERTSPSKSPIAAGMGFAVSPAGGPVYTQAPPQDVMPEAFDLEEDVEWNRSHARAKRR